MSSRSLRSNNGTFQSEVHIEKIPIITAPFPNDCHITRDAQLEAMASGPNKPQMKNKGVPGTFQGGQYVFTIYDKRSQDCFNHETYFVVNPSKDIQLLLESRLAQEPHQTH